MSYVYIGLDDGHKRLASTYISQW